MADAACLWSGRVLPPNGAKDWNAVLDRARFLPPAECRRWTQTRSRPRSERLSTLAAASAVFQRSAKGQRALGAHTDQIGPIRTPTSPPMTA